MKGVIVEPKQDKLTFDSTPTHGSSNPVTSGGTADAIAQSTARVNYSLTNVVSQSTPQYELYKIGNRVYLNVHSLWKASVAKDTWETWATIPADLVKDIGSANPSTVASLVNGNNGNVVGTTMIEINKSNHDLRVKSPVALSAGPAAGYGLVFVIDWYNV